MSMSRSEGPRDIDVLAEAVQVRVRVGVRPRDIDVLAEAVQLQAGTIVNVAVLFLGYSKHVLRVQEPSQGVRVRDREIDGVDERRKH